MKRVIVASDAAGLPVMLADLIRGNLERDPGRVALIEEGPGRINLHVTDVEVDVGILFTGTTVSFGSVLPEPDLAFTCESEVLMALTRVPLRFGMPDQLTTEGRLVSRWLMNGTLRVHGIPKHLGLMIRLQRLFTVAT